jgi:hypothetical protein
MRAVFGFFSMLALGLMIAAVIVVGATDTTNGPIRLPVTGVYLDYASVVIGLAMGIVIVVLGQIRWSDLPRRAAQLIAAHWRKLRLFAWAALFVAVLVYF